MVFSSIPPYLDPSNWHHQVYITFSSLQFQKKLFNLFKKRAATNYREQRWNELSAPPAAAPSSAWIRPEFDSARIHVRAARMANIPMPETALKCPRCDSTNTKFCYFNNYSLTQPRHFCKTCRRYWTLGGALRNVPVGGGCRRNKRSTKSSSSSKSSPTSSERQGNPNPSSSGCGGGTSAPPPQMRFVSPLSQLGDGYGSEFGLSYGGGVTAAAAVGTSEMSFHCGGGGGIEGWRMQQFQQFPFLGGLDSTVAAGMFGGQFNHGGESGFMGGGGGETSHHQDVRPPAKVSSSMLSQMAAVKMEDRHLERQVLGGGMARNEQWNPLTVNWTELSSFSSSSTTNNNPL